jgi:hypothetical protein
MVDRGTITSQLEHPGRRIGEEPLEQTLVTALEAGSIESRSGQGEVRQDFCAREHVVTLCRVGGARVATSHDRRCADLTVGP